MMPMHFLKRSYTVSSASKLYLPLFPSHRASPSFGWYSGTHFTVPRRVECSVDLGGWLHTEIKCRPWESNPDTVTHPCTDRARVRSGQDQCATTTLNRHGLDMFLCFDTRNTCTVLLPTTLVIRQSVWCMCVRTIIFELSDH